MLSRGCNHGARAIYDLDNSAIPRYAAAMEQQNNHFGNVLLLRVGMVTMLIALVLAWCLIFTKAMQLPFATELFKQPDKLLSSHLDFLMMTMLLLGFYCVRVPLPAMARWPMAIGSITNPTCFLIESLYVTHPPAAYMPFAYTSVTITTIGYALAAITLLRWTLR